MKNVRLSQMSEEDRSKFHSKLVGILQKIMEICEANNIHWFVGYGACIGAIRHKGCIPWDDDIDICMPRPDYDRFVEICKKTELGDYELANLNDTPGYRVHLIRMYDKNSTMYFYTAAFHVAGIFIDIFPIDGASDGNIERNYRYCRFWLKISWHSRSYYSMSDIWKLLKKRKIRLCLLFLFTSLFRYSLQKVSLKMIEKTARKYPYERSMYCKCYDDVVYGMRSVILKEWIEETIWVPFENIQVRVPKYYHEYLTHIYGDYMTPPPDDKKDDRHFVLYLDFERRLTRNEILNKLSEE